MGTIQDLNELAAASLATNDYLLVRDTSDPSDKDKKIAAGAFTFKSQTASPIADRVAKWKDANSLEDAGYAFGDVARVNVAQTFTLQQTFNAGIKFANEAITLYDENDAYLPFLLGDGGNPTTTFGLRHCTARLINKVCIFQITLGIATISGGSGLVRISLPYNSHNLNYQTGSFYFADASSSLSYPGVFRIDANNNTVLLILPSGFMSVSGLGAGDLLTVAGSYFTA